MSSPQDRRGHGRTRAKFILIGEHSVVYGRPAIAVPLPNLAMEATAAATSLPLSFDSSYYAGPLSDAPDAVAAPAAAIRATLEHLGVPLHGVAIRTESSIPAERGLGSSAATAGAIVHALADLHGRTLDDDERFELVQVAERVAHGNPSGLDAVATDASHPVWFEDGRHSELPLRLDGCFVIGDTGVRGRTKHAVGDVRALRRLRPGFVERRLDLLAELTTASAGDLTQGRARELGGRLSLAHAALRELGVSSADLDRLVEAATGAGALGAKLTGGGQGGCMVALAATEEDGREVARALTRAGARRTWLYDTLLSAA